MNYTIRSQFEEFGGKTSKNDLDSVGTSYCVFQCTFPCFTCCLVSKFFQSVNLQERFLTSKLTYFGLKHSSTTPKGLPKGSYRRTQTLARNCKKQSQSTDINHPQQLHRRLIDWVNVSTLSSGSVAAILAASDQNHGRARWCISWSTAHQCEHGLTPAIFNRCLSQGWVGKFTQGPICPI